MKTIEIPRREWTSSLDEFSQIHKGWLVSLQVMTPSIGAQPEFHDLPLVGITAEPGGEGTITIAVAQAPASQLTHTIHGPSKVSIERTDAGADVAVEIQAHDGATAILQFKTVARPETVDGVAQLRA